MSRPKSTTNEWVLLSRRLVIDELVLRSQNVYILNIISYADHIYDRRVPLAAAAADNNLSPRTGVVRGAEDEPLIAAACLSNVHIRKRFASLGYKRFMHRRVYCNRKWSFEIIYQAITSSGHKSLGWL